MQQIPLGSMDGVDTPHLVMKAPSGGTFDQTGTIAKRKKWAIIAGVTAVLVVLIFGIGLGLGLNGADGKKSSSKDVKNPGSQSTSSSTPTATTSSKLESGNLEFTKSPSPVDWDQVHNDATLLTPDVVVKFLSDLAAFSKVKLQIPTMTADSIVLLLREVRGDYYPVLYALEKFARGEFNETATPTDLQTLAGLAVSMLSRDGMYSWGVAIADRHPNLTTIQEVPDFLDMVKLAQTHDIALPMYQQTSEMPEAPAPMAAGRKLMADPAWQFPKICVPVVFHILQYRDSNGILQPAPKYADDTTLISRVNAAFENAELPGGGADSLIRFYSAEVRTATDFPYLLVDDFDTWNNCWRNVSGGSKWLLKLAEMQNADPKHNINVYICGTAMGEKGQSCLDGDDIRCPPGYAWAPQQNHPEGAGDESWAQSHVHLLWDNIDNSLNNKPDGSLFGQGGWALTHLIGHHFGLWHPHHVAESATPCVEDGDVVTDTAVTKVVSTQSYFPDLLNLCDSWRAKQGWANPKQPWTTYKGVSIKTFDSCPDSPGFDPVFNVMEFIPPSCNSYFTANQVKRMWYTIPAFRPSMYTNGQDLQSKQMCGK